MIFFIFILSFVFSQPEELVDGVLAVVENKNILFSEVLGEARMVAEQKGINPQNSPLLFQSVFDNILNEKINLNVVLVYAEKDSLISVSYEEISRSLDERISMFSSQLGSPEALEEAFGLSLADIKNNYWDTVREEIIIEKFKYSFLGDVSVSKEDVSLFYNNYKDSIPKAPPLASFSILHKKIEHSSLALNKIINKLKSIKDSVDVLGLPFDSFVLKYSEDPSVSINKGIMTTSRGDLVPEYEKIAYSLEKNEISSPTKSSFGYHLIKLLDRVGEKITSQHLLLSIKPNKEDSLESVSFLDSLLSLSFNDPGFFDSLAVTHKKDRLNISGNYSNIEVDFFPPIVVDSLSILKPFSFSSVFGNNSSQYLLYKYSFMPKKKRTLSGDWSFIESLALNNKRSLLFELWIEEQITKTYVKINKNY